MPFGPLFDKNDPIWHSTDSPEAAQAAFLAKHKRWLAGQHPEVARLYFEHGQYVGKDGILSYLCKLGCPDRQRGPKTEGES
jgi:hypothetical protein